jgi:hypothetical protein
LSAWLADGGEDLFGDVVDWAVGIKGIEESCCLEATQHGCCLALERLESLANRGCGVVGSPSYREPLYGNLVGHGEFNRGVETVGNEPEQQCVELVEISGKAIEQKPAVAHIRLAETPPYEFIDESIGNETSFGDAFADAVSERCPAPDGTAQQLTRRDVGNRE